MAQNYTALLILCVSVRTNVTECFGQPATQNVLELAIYTLSIHYSVHTHPEVRSLENKPLELPIKLIHCGHL